MSEVINNQQLAARTSQKFNLMQVIKPEAKWRRVAGSVDETSDGYS